MKRLSLSLALLCFSATSWAGLEQCQQLKDPQQRLRCSEQLLQAYEAYFNKKGLPLLSSKETAKGVDKYVKAQAKENFGMEQKKLEEEKKEIETIAAVVEKIKKDPYGKLILTLNNQQIWKLTDKGPRIKKGDSVEISRGALGSFYVKKVGTSRTARAKRIQ